MSKQPAPSYGAALEYCMNLFGGILVENEQVALAIAATPPGTVAVDANGGRVALVIVNNGINDVFAQTTAPTAGGTGIRLTALGGFMSLDVTRDFTLPSRRWYVSGNGGVSTVNTLELIRVTQAEITP